MKSKLLLILAIVASLFVVIVIIKKNAAKKLDSFDQKKSYQSVVTSDPKMDPLIGYWEAEGNCQAHPIDQVAIDYCISRNDSISNNMKVRNMFYKFEPSGKGAIISSNKKIILSTFDYSPDGKILSVNGGNITLYFQKYNDKLYVSVDGGLKLRKVE